MSHRSETTFARLFADRKGTIAIITALCATVVLGFVGLAADVALWQLNGRKIQTAADAAALAGAVASASNDNVTSAVDAVAGNFGYIDDQNGVSVSVNQDYHNLKEVAVTISALQPQFFTRLFMHAPTVTKIAVAAAPSQPQKSGMCVLALNRAGKTGTGSVGTAGVTNVNLNNCGLYDDSQEAISMNLSGTVQFNAAQIFLSGGYYAGSETTMTPSTPTATYAAPTPDPFADMTVPTYSGCDQRNYLVNSGQTVTASPGVYCGGIKVLGGGTLKLQPGTYILDSGSFDVEGNGTVTGTGVTIILTSSNNSNYGTVTLRGGSNVSLTAPGSDADSGVPGIAIWVDKNAPNASDTMLGGNTQNISGVVYMPSQALTYSGGETAGGECTQLIADTVTFTGNAALDVSGCSSSSLPIGQALAPPRLVL